MTSLEKIIQHLKNDGLIIYPTETAYALGCDATNKKAIKKIFVLKKRTPLKKLPLIMSSIDMVKEFAEMNKEEELLAKTYWPGAVTLVLRAKKNLPKSIVETDGTIAARISGNKRARILSENLKKPITSTSANISGSNNCYSYACIQKNFKSYINDGTIMCISKKTLNKVKPSTIIKIKKGKLIVVRKGSVPVDYGKN